MQLLIFVLFQLKSFANQFNRVWGINFTQAIYFCNLLISDIKRFVKKNQLPEANMELVCTVALLCVFILYFVYTLINYCSLQSKLEIQVIYLVAGSNLLSRR